MSDLLKQLTPPPGGLVKLREKLNKSDDGKLLYYPGAIGGAILAGLAAISLLVFSYMPTPTDFELQIQAELERIHQIEPFEFVAANGDVLASLKVETSNPNVVLYWVN